MPSPVTLVEPPAVWTEPARLAAATPGVVVPGGPVYEIDPSVWELLDKILPPWMRPSFKPVPGTTPSTTPSVPLPFPSAVIDALNTERSKAGRAALVFADDLTGVAFYWAQSEAKGRKVTHGPPGSSAPRIRTVRPSFRTAGEIVAGGQSTVEEVVAAWMNSAPHRANILNPSFTAAGAGVARGGDGSLYWCVDFTG